MKDVCPSCKSPDVRRSRSRTLRDRLMKVTGLLPYRCRECRRRFYLNKFEDERLQRYQLNVAERQPNPAV